MEKITFVNETNGLSVEFSTTTPFMFLENFNGSSCGAEAVTYRPLEYDGQKFITANLNPRTITFTINIGGKTGRYYSRKEALSRWDYVRRVFVPGQYGTLTWTDGKSSRFIRCRTSETPACDEILDFLFSARFEMIADSPLWFDTVQHYKKVTGNHWSLENNCGIAVPLLIVVEEDVDAFSMAFKYNGKQYGIGMGNTIGEQFTIDTAACTVTTKSGELVNHMLTVNSEFFKLPPGITEFVSAGGGTVEFYWRDAYIGTGG